MKPSCTNQNFLLLTNKAISLRLVGKLFFQLTGEKITPGFFVRFEIPRFSPSVGQNGVPTLVNWQTMKKKPLQNIFLLWWECKKTFTLSNGY